MALSAPSLLQILSVRELARLLDVNYAKTLAFVLYRMKDSQKYRAFEIPRKAGGTRTIHTPRPILMKLQKRLLPLLQALYTPPPCVHGHVSRRSIVTNAKAHVGRRVIANVDIKDFFPSIHFKRIENILKSRRYGLAEPVARAIAQLCCHQGRLPVGAPTSGILSNIVCGPMDTELMRLAKGNNIRYSRYVDDLTFSSFNPQTMMKATGIFLNHRLLSSDISDLSANFTAIFSENGFSINPTKVQIRGPHVRQGVTGLTVNKKVNVSSEFFRSLRGALNAIQKHGIAAAQQEYDKRRRSTWAKNIEDNVLGRISYLGQVTEYGARYQRIAHRARTVFPHRNIYVPLAQKELAVFQLTTLIDKDEGTAFHLGDGYFLTAAHVFGRISEVRTATLVQPSGGVVATITVNVLEIDFDLDIALMHTKSDTSHLPNVRLVDRTLLAGDEVIAIGFPQYSQGNSWSSIVARLTGHRHLFGAARHEVDRPFPHGASGGPVFDAHGYGIGIVLSGPQLGVSDAPMATTFSGYALFKLTLAEWMTKHAKVATPTAESQNAQTSLDF